MKKILITTLMAAATVASSFAQGSVGFANGGTSLITLNGTTQKMFGSAGTYDFGLYMGSAGSTSLSEMQLVALAASPSTVSTSFNAGLFAFPGTTVNSPGNVANTIDFVAGTQYAFFVAGWAASGGSNYMSAVAAGAGNGVSALGFITPVVAPTPIPNVFGTAAGQIGGFIITTPEPATIAICGLGASALLLFRRRK